LGVFVLIGRPQVAVPDFVKEEQKAHTQEQNDCGNPDLTKIFSFQNEMRNLREVNKVPSRALFIVHGRPPGHYRRSNNDLRLKPLQTYSPSEVNCRDILQTIQKKAPLAKEGF
jgi:hypothetical protein